MAQHPIDAALADLAALEADFEDKHELILEISDELVDQPALGAQLVARMLTCSDGTDELDDMSALLAHALDRARMAQENRQKRGARFISAVEEAVELAARQGALELWHRLLFASIWMRNGLPAPKALEMSATDWGPADSADGEPEQQEMIEQLFTNLEEISGTDPVDIHAALAELLVMLPVDARAFAIQIAVSRPGPIYGQVGVLWLLDPDPALRLAAAEGLAARQQEGHLTRDILADIVMVRSWIPRDSSHALLDQILAEGLRASPTPTKSPRHWRIGEIIASLPDGSGAQSIAIGLHSGRKRSLAMVLLKQQHGITDAFLVPVESASAQKDVTGKLIEQTGALAVTTPWLEQTLAVAIAEGLEAGRPPPVGLIEIARDCGMEALRPQTVSTSELLASLAESSGAAKMTARERSQLVRMDKSWWRFHELSDSWFEQSDRVHERLQQAEDDAARAAAVWEELEERRDWWTANLVRSAHLLEAAGHEAAGHEEAAVFVATAMALAEGEDLKKIGFMKLLHEQTLDAWLAANSEIDSEDDDLDLEVTPPEPERQDELAQLLKGSDISTDWIDGFVMAVGLSPAGVDHNEWISEVVTQVIGTLDRSQLQRFVELLMLRSYQAFEQAADHSVLASRLEQRSEKEKLAWAAGFRHAHQEFRTAWPRRLLAAKDRKMIKLIAAAEETPFTTAEIRPLSKWIETRREKSLAIK